jgi:hypothetical protein
MPDQTLNVDAAGSIYDNWGLDQCGSASNQGCKKTTDRCTSPRPSGATCMFSSEFNFDCNATTVTGSLTYTCASGCQSTYDVKGTVTSFDPRGDM